MSLNEYYEKKVRIVSKNGETFEGDSRGVRCV